jgi:LacI family transcriptional regulator
MGAYQAAAEHGLQIPRDLSIIGFDEHELIAASLRPTLTTVALPLKDMGAWAVQVLLAPSPQARPCSLPCHLIRGESVSAPSTWSTN